MRRSYPGFIALTSHEYPRLLYTRHPPADAKRWGPFPDAGAAKRVIQLLRRQFGIRDCPELLPKGCLAMHIGLCTGPCIDGTGYDELKLTADDGAANDYFGSWVAIDGDTAVIELLVMMISKNIEENLELYFKILNLLNL